MLRSLCNSPTGEFLVIGATERHSNLLLIVILVGAAVIHFVPQVSEYLLTTWMVVGLGGAAFLSLLLLQDWGQQGRDRLTRFHWILLIVYLMHQFEEHGVDLFGRGYFFVTYFQNLVSDFGEGSGPLSPLAIYRINTLLVWLPFLIAVWGRRHFIWPCLAAAGLTFTNGIFHIGMALWRGQYNPGLGSAIVLFLPVALLFFRFVREHCGIGWLGIASGVLFGVAAHGAQLLGILSNLRSAPPAAVFGVLALAPLIANLLYNWLRRNNGKSPNGPH